MLLLQSNTVTPRGLGFGCVYVATNLYVAECAPTRLRGSFVGTVSQFGYQLGTLIAFWAGYGMSFHKSPNNIAWRVSNAIQIPIGIFFIILSFWYPESPRWLVSSYLPVPLQCLSSVPLKGRPNNLNPSQLERYPDDPDSALKVLAKIRSGTPQSEHVQLEFRELTMSREYRQRHEIPGYWGLLKSAAMRKRLLYGFYAAALQQVRASVSLIFFPS